MYIEVTTLSWKKNGFIHCFYAHEDLPYAFSTPAENFVKVSGAG